MHTYSVIVYKVSPVNLSELKYYASAGNTGYLGYYVNSSGTLHSSYQSGDLGRIAYLSSSDVEVYRSGSRILILALSDLGGYYWKTAATTGDAAWNSTTAMNGMSFCASHQSSTYPAAKAAWKANTISGTSYWFFPSIAQATKMFPVAIKSGTGQLVAGRVYWTTTDSGTCGVHYAWRYGGATHNNMFSWGGHSTGKATAFQIRQCCAY